jgi:Zn-dependent protease with chaperone function
MNILVKENDQEAGPYSSDQVKDLLYSGKLKHSALARLEDSNEWLPVENLLGGVPTHNPPPPVIANIPIDRLRDAKEKTALTFLYLAAIPAAIFLAIWIVASFGIVLIIGGLISFAMLIGQLWFTAYLRTNAIRVSPQQLPELFQVVQSSCSRLGLEIPEVYVMQQNVWNAFALKVWGRRMVVLLSGAVDSILLTGDMHQLSWLVGHELGHHAAGHLDFKRKLANFGDWCVWLKLWYSRRREFTCDRVALYCAGSLQASQLALVNATVGSQLAAKVSIPEAINQWHQHREEFFVKYRTLYSTHPHHLARLDNLAVSAAELGIPR